MKQQRFEMEELCDKKYQKELLAEQNHDTEVRIQMIKNVLGLNRGGPVKPNDKK